MRFGSNLQVSMVAGLKKAVWKERVDVQFKEVAENQTREQSDLNFAAAEPGNAWQHPNWVRTPDTRT